MTFIIKILAWLMKGKRKSWLLCRAKDMQKRKIVQILRKINWHSSDEFVLSLLQKLITVRKVNLRRESRIYRQEVPLSKKESIIRGFSTTTSRRTLQNCSSHSPSKVNWNWGSKSWRAYKKLDPRKRCHIKLKCIAINWSQSSIANKNISFFFHTKR